MYKTFEGARKAALDVINKRYGGEKMGCVVTENRLNGCVWFGFQFCGEDSRGEFKKLDDDTETRSTRI